MLSVLPDQTVPSAKFSKRKINCKCSCGNPNTISVSWLSFSRRITPTCGKCAVFKWRGLNKISYGRLTLNCELDSITAVRQIVLWKCDCGNNKKIKLFAVISGNTTSCGCAYQDMKPKYNTRETKTKEEWLVDFPNLIDENLPESWSRKARLVCSFNCKCGNIFKSPFGIIRKSCGRCNEIAVDENYVINGFTYDGDDKVLKPTLDPDYLDGMLDKC